MMHSRALSLIICAFSLSFILHATAAITLPRVISNHMVLQQGVAVPIWGTADPNEAVTVTFRDQTKSATADAQGKWMVKLDPLKVGDGTPTTLTVAGSNTITVNDVLVGEVWVGSGQSNLETDTYDYTQWDTDLAAAAKVDHPNVRLYRSDFGTGWQVTNSQTVGRFSAQFFYFGVKLQEALNVPVGLMEGAMRGSPSGPWISQDAFKADPDIMKAVAAAEAKNPMDVRMQKYNDAETKWQADVAAAKAAGTPDNKLPKEPHKPLPYDVHVGDLYEKHIRPMIPYAMKGVLWDQGEGGDALDSIPVWQPTAMKALINGWRADWAQGDFPWLYVEKPSGEGAALNPDDPIHKECSPISPLPKDPPGWQPGWPPRFDYLRIKDLLPNVYMVTASDLAQCPTPQNPHPHMKSTYATRDVQVALGAVYGKPVEYYGPVYQSMALEGDKIRLTFTHVGKGLTTPQNAPVQGFAVAGDDKKFHWATATIDGQNIVLSCPDVPTPVTVQYAWAPFDITWANLFNVDGLPAIPFSAKTSPDTK